MCTPTFRAADVSSYCVMRAGVYLGATICPGRDSTFNRYGARLRWTFQTLFVVRRRCLFLEGSHVAEPVPSPPSQFVVSLPLFLRRYARTRLTHAKRLFHLVGMRDCFLLLLSCLVSCSASRGAKAKGYNRTRIFWKSWSKKKDSILQISSMVFASRVR